MSKPLPFQTFQYAFAQHIRDPEHVPRPNGVPARRAQVYTELLFSNVCGFLDRCFPVCQRVLSQSAWTALCRGFFRDWPSHTPWFRDIPREFVRYLSSIDEDDLAFVWLPALTHYEWVELALEVMDAAIETHARPPADAAELLSHTVVVNPALMLLQYDWPVHRIGASFMPDAPEPTSLIVYRDRSDAIQFMVSNPMTLALLETLKETPNTGLQACQTIAAATQHPNPTALTQFAAPLLMQLFEKEVLHGIKEH